MAKVKKNGLAFLLQLHAISFQEGQGHARYQYTVIQNGTPIRPIKTIFQVNIEKYCPFYGMGLNPNIVKYPCLGFCPSLLWVAHKIYLGY